MVGVGLYNFLIGLLHLIVSHLLATENDILADLFGKANDMS